MGGNCLSAQKHGKKGKIFSSTFLNLVAKFVAGKTTQQTSAEQFHQSSRYETFRQQLRDILRNIRLQSLPRSIWLYLLRRGRLPKAKPGHARTTKIMNRLKLQKSSNHSNTSEQFIQS